MQRIRDRGARGVEAVGAVAGGEWEVATEGAEQASAARDRGGAVAVAGEGLGAANEAVAAVIGRA